jgi:hypothetical protein
MQYQLGNYVSSFCSFVGNYDVDIETLYIHT